MLKNKEDNIVKRITVFVIALLMLAMTIYANAEGTSNKSVFSETGSFVETIPSQNIAFENDAEESFEDVSDISVAPVLGSAEPKNAPGEYDSKYFYDWIAWQKNFESYIENNKIKPERTEPWWDEWIAEMLSEGLIEQSWYDEMIAKGYIIEVD